MKRNLTILLLLVLMSAVNGQISISESFSSSSLPSSWSSNTSHSTSSNYYCISSGARYKNLYGSNNNAYIQTSDLGTQVSGSTISVSYNFSVKEYSSYNATPAGEFDLTVYYSTDGSTWTAINGSEINGTNYTPSTTCQTSSFSFSSPGTSSLYLKFNCDYNTGDFYISYDDITISESSPCSGTPAPGNTISEVSSISASSVCSGTTVDFSLQNSTGTGATYQWESSIDGTNYSVINGETNETYSGTITAETYYRCAVTCSGNTGYSNAQLITLNSSPTTQPNSATFSATSYSIDPSWTPASDGDGTLIIHHTSTLTANPTDGSSYSAGSSIGGGTVGFVGTNSTGTIGSLSANTNYTLTFFSYNMSDDGCMVFNTNTPYTATQYTTPGNITSPAFSNITSSSFDLSWNAPSSGANSYIYTVYSDYYSTPVVGLENISTTNTSISISGLNSSSTYYVRVFAVGAGGTGSSYNAGSVTTSCATTSAPMTQDFGTSSAFLQCWERYSGAISTSSSLSSTTSGWSMESYSSYRPSNFTGSFKKISAYGSDGPFWLVSESIDLGSTPGLYKLNFDLALSSSSYYSSSSTLGTHQLDVLISEDDGATWSSTNTLATYTGSSNITNSGQTESFNLTNYSGTVRFAFVLTEGMYTSRYVGIDNFEIEALPACSGTPAPGNTIAEVSSNSVTSVCSGTTVDFSLQNGDNLGIGVSLQWETSTDGTTYNSISGANSLTYSGAVNSAAYYRCAVTCSGSTGYSTPIQISINSSPTDQGSGISFAATSSTITPSWTAATSADGYLVIYHTSALTADPTDGSSYSIGDAVGGGTVGYVGSDVTCTISGLASNTSYDVTVYSYNQSDDGCKMFNVTLPLTGSGYTTPGTISSPSFLNTTSSGFDLSWSQPTNGANSYLYTVYSDYYNTPVSSAYENVSTTSTSVSVTGLSASTTYYVRIWTVGTGGTGSTYNAGSITTSCATTSAPLTQDFGTSSAFLQCWVRYTGAVSTSSSLSSTSSGWSMESSSSYRPSNFSGSFKEISAYGYDGPYWLVSESIDLGSTAGAYRLNFDLALSSSYYYSSSSTLGTHQLDVLISEDDGATWSSTNTIATYDGSSTITNSGQTESFDLTNYSGTVKFAFVLTEGMSTTRYVGIDNFEIEALPNCSGIPDNGVTLSSQSGSAGTSTVLSVGSFSTSMGLTYQWQSSADNLTYTDITGETNAELSATIGSTGVYYHRKTTCSNSGQYSLSWPVYVVPSTGYTSINLGLTGSQSNSCGTNVLLYDDGGASSSYSNNSSGSLELSNSGGAVITISGTSATENNYDYLKIYDGIGTTGSQLVSYTGSSNTVSYSSSPGQSLTIQLTSDGSSTAAGIELYITYSEGCNAIVYDGSNWSQTPTSMDDVMFTGDYSVSGNEEYNSVTINGANITIPPNQSLSVTTDLWVNSSSTLVSESSAAGYSQLFVGGHIRNEGSITQESTLKGQGAVGISSSMKEGLQNVTGLTTSALYQYNGSSGAYATASNLTTPGVGYFGIVGSGGIMNSTGDFSVVGTPNTSFTHSLEYASNQASGGSGSGWNLLGNPYTTQLDWSTVTKSNVNDAIYIWNRSGGKYKYHVNGATAPSGSNISGVLSTSEIPPMHAFWVQASSSGASISTTMSDHCSISTSPGHHNKAQADNIIVSVEDADNSSVFDATWIIHNPSSTLSFDGHSDAWKMYNPNGPNIFSLIADDDLAINAMDLSNAVSIPIEVENLQDGHAYLLKLDQMITGSAYDVWLEDRYFNTQSAIGAEGYLFVSEPYFDKNTRFIVHIRPQLSANIGIAQNELENIVIYADNAYIHVLGELEGYDSYLITSMNGQTIAEGKLSSNMSIKRTQSSGIFIVHLYGPEKVFNQKISITK